MQQVARITMRPETNHLANMMFLKGSFYFPSRSNAHGDGLEVFSEKDVKLCAVWAGGIMACIWVLQNAAQLTGKKICNDGEINH
ncbi:hypothetical protein [Lelliottia amnigena]|uniref:hypothetical protein n=1 Tax=Lelliottia amnigena TaxID=61646 RepID=UPI0021D82F9E|nr:hypothetical protein [Lelliottia amnigena]MCU7782228.1 hypothetical protein [Lelliottia amnigena]